MPRLPDKATEADKEEWWKEMKLKTVESIEDGLVVERPDYWVVRVSLVDMNNSEVSRLESALRHCPGGMMAVHAKASLAKMKARRDSISGRGEQYPSLVGS